MLSLPSIMLLLSYPLFIDSVVFLHSHALEAIKEGHVFHSSPDGLNFSHQKLSSLRIHVVDEVFIVGVFDV